MGTMKKIIFPAVALFLLFFNFQQSYAKTYYRTFKVAEITGEGVVLKDFEGGRLLVNKDPSGLKIGDSVRYDTVRNVLKKNPWQPATVTKMGNNSLTLQFSNGEKEDVNMRSNYRNKFKKGDKVLYKATSGQLKKSNFQKLKK